MRTAEKKNLPKFEAFSTVSFDDVDDALSSKILKQLTSLRKKILRYFPEILASDLKLVRKSFAVPVEEVRDNLQDELIDHKNNSLCKDMFNTLSICKLWAKMYVCYPFVAKECITKLLPFTSKY